MKAIESVLALPESFHANTPPKAVDRIHLHYTKLDYPTSWPKHPRPSAEGKALS